MVQSSSPSSSSASSDLRQTIKQSIVAAISSLGIDSPIEVLLEKPAETDRGDLSSPVAMQLIRSLTPEQRGRFHSPFQLATAIVETLRSKLAEESGGSISSVDAVAPGFINFRFSHELLLGNALQMAQLAEASREVPTISEKNCFLSKKVVIEYVSPNTNKPLHIGHLRNAALGYSLSKLLAAQGNASVRRAIIFNDRGLHIMKSCWGYLTAGRQGSSRHEHIVKGELESIATAVGESLQSSNSASERGDWQTTLEQWQQSAQEWLQPAMMEDSRLRKSDHFIGFWYQLAEHFAENPTVTAEWSQMLQCWEDSSHPLHQSLRQLWSTMNVWFYKGFEQTRERFGFGFDASDVSYESQIYQKGKNLVIAAADQGIFERLPDGAVTARLESAGLPDKILLRRDGTGIYMTFDIELTRQRTASDAQQLIWIVGVDQQLYFQQLFAVTEKLGYGEQNRYHHLAYGMVRLPDGKMSSRKGRVLYADDILELAVNQAKAIMSETKAKDQFDVAEFDRVAEAIGIGAVKWTMLSVDALSEITFDIATSVSFKGFAGPYVQYTYARCQSVLRAAKQSVAIDLDVLRSILIQKGELKLENTEVDILRFIYTYYETIRFSTESLAPHIVCGYLYELCQRFNTFYTICPILSDDSIASETKQLRLLLTSVTATILFSGLDVLGITAVERM